MITGLSRSVRCLYFDKGDWSGRRVEVSLECDAWKPVEALAEPLSALADGDLHWAASGDGWASGLLESGLGAEEPSFQISSLDP
jgi:hypothetical protein